MFCKFCGQNIPATSEFCPECGKQIIPIPGEEFPGVCSGCGERFQ